MSGLKIDWSSIHLRLQKVSAELESGFLPDAEDTERILKARADILAREPKETGAAGSIEIVEFLLSNERYGIESRFVREVYPIKNYTPLPGTPAFILGIINVRGQIVSIVNIKKFFDMPDKGISDLNKVIIIHGDEMEFGVLADEILGVRAAMPDELQPAPPTFTGVHLDYLLGIGQEHTIILDAHKLLTDNKMIVHEDVI